MTSLRIYQVSAEPVGGATLRLYEVGADFVPQATEIRLYDVLAEHFELEENITTIRVYNIDAVKLSLPTQIRIYSISAQTSATTFRIYKISGEAVNSVEVQAPGLARAYHSVSLTGKIPQDAEIWEFTQVSGPTVTESVQDGPSFAYRQPPAVGEDPVVWSVRAMVEGVWTSSIFVTVGNSKWKHWQITAAGVKKPARPTRKRLGPLVLIPPPPPDPDPDPDPDPPDPPDPDPEPPAGNEHLWFTPTENIQNFNTAVRIDTHYFSPYPRSFDNTVVDSVGGGYNSQLNPDTSTYASYGGNITDRAWPRNPLSGDWIYKDAEWQVKWMMEAGLDGSYCDLIGTARGNPQSTRWRYEQTMLAAEALYPDGRFKVIPMVDGSDHVGIWSATDSFLADYLASFAFKCDANFAPIFPLVKRASSRWWRDGRFIVASFNTPGTGDQTSGPSYARWNSIFDAFKNKYGYDVAFVSTFNNINSHAAAWTAAIPRTVVEGPWVAGAADPKTVTNYSGHLGTRSRGKEVLMGVSPAYGRRSQRQFDNEMGFQAYVAGWKKAITIGAEWIQLVTSSDFAEFTQIQPSAKKGWTLVDLTRYFVEWRKKGVQPTVIRDCILLSHKVHPWQMTASKGGQLTSPFTVGGRTVAGTTPLENIVDCVVFLTAPATISITVGTNTVTRSGTAGMNQVSAPISTFGNVSASVTRNGVVTTSVTSPVPYRSSHPRYDNETICVSSLRPNVTSRQFLPFYDPIRGDTV